MAFSHLLKLSECCTSVLKINVPLPVLQRVCLTSILVSKTTSLNGRPLNRSLAIVSSYCQTPFLKHCCLKKATLLYVNIHVQF